MPAPNNTLLALHGLPESETKAQVSKRHLAAGVATDIWANRVRDSRGPWNPSLRTRRPNAQPQLHLAGLKRNGARLAVARTTGAPASENRPQVPKALPFAELCWCSACPSRKSPTSCCTAAALPLARSRRAGSSGKTVSADVGLWRRRNQHWQLAQASRVPPRGPNQALCRRKVQRRCHRSALRCMVRRARASVARGWCFCPVPANNSLRAATSLPCVAWTAGAWWSPAHNRRLQARVA